jgi:Flp pilus assembly protein TadG
MRRLSDLAGLARRTEGAAAVEFALVGPFLVFFFVGLADLSFAYHDQLQLSAALAAGAQYAFTKGQTESSSALPGDVTSFVNSISAVTLTSVSASYNNGLSGSSCYCVKGSPAVYTGPLTCGSACTDGSGSTAGKYLSISASYAYTPMFSLDQAFLNSSFTQSVTVRLQ